MYLSLFCLAFSNKPKSWTQAYPSTVYVEEAWGLNLDQFFLTYAFSKKRKQDYVRVPSHHFWNFKGVVVQNRNLWFGSTFKRKHKIQVAWEVFVFCVLS